MKPSPDFQAAAGFEAGSIHVTDWPLCQVRLQDDARFPWLILLPRVAGAVEVEDLSVEQRQILMEEMVQAGALIRQMADVMDLKVDKLNMAALGNVTSQLHVHVVGRRHDDGLWPDPIWGRPGAKPLETGQKQGLLRIVREY